MPWAWNEGPQFKTKADWERHKAELNRMARFFEKVAGQAARGERLETKVVNVKDFKDRHLGKDEGIGA